jgi:hypothetical protein
LKHSKRRIRLELTKVLESQNIGYEEVHTTKHSAFSFTLNGKPTKYIYSGSTDWRAMYNARAGLKRLIHNGKKE